MKALTLNNIKKRFDGVHAIENLSFAFEKGKITGIAGTNGSGKSTLINLITGSIPFGSGYIIIGNKPLKKVVSHVMRKNGISRTFQDVRLFNQMSVIDNILAVLSKTNVLHSLLGFKKANDIKIAKSVLEQVGLWEIHRKKAQNLSYGQRKLLEIARILAVDTDILFFDEPFTGLSPRMLIHISAILKRLRNNGKTIILVEHNVLLLRQLCDYMLVLDSGHLLSYGSPDKVFREEKVKEAYLGKQTKMIKQNNTNKNKNNIIRLKNVSVHFQDIHILDKINLNLRDGEIVALLGPNGAGKSTILKTIFGLVSTSNGKIYWQGISIKPNPYKLVANNATFVPQGRRVFTSLTVDENLEISGLILPKKELIARINSVLNFFPNLKRKRNKLTSILSGGEQQMLSLARALMINPHVLLLDEPTLGLAPKVAEEVIKKIKEINTYQKTAILIVEHNIKSILEISDRAYILDKGKIIINESSSILLKKYFQKSLPDYSFLISR